VIEIMTVVELKGGRRLVIGWFSIKRIFFSFFKKKKNEREGKTLGKSILKPKKGIFLKSI
jgi:hypothetical protein